MAETVADGKTVHLKPDDCVLDNVVDKRTLWRRHGLK